MHLSSCKVALHGVDGGAMLPGMVPDNADVWQIGTENWVVAKLPDGSTAVFDTSTKTVHSIHQTAAAAFEACRHRRTVSQLATAMQEILQSPVTEETALAAVYELQRAGLVACSAATPLEHEMASRRSVLQAMGTAAAAAAPLVLSLTAAEQSAYAQGANSGNPPSIDHGDSSGAICTNVSSTQGLFIQGYNTHFSQGTSVVTVSVPWLIVSNVMVLNATQIQFSVTVTGTPPSGSGTFSGTVKTGSEMVTGTNIFIYQACQFGD